MRLLVRLCAGLFCVAIAYLAAAVAGALIPGRVADIAGGDDVEIVLVAGPIHYDILLPLNDDTRQAFTFVAEAGVPLDAADWLVVGWGSRAFYTTTGDYTDLDVSVIWDAASGDASVLRFDAAYGDWSDYGTAVPLSMDQYARLRGEILQVLTRGDAGFAFDIPGASLTQTDVFFEAQSRFSILRTCNVWIGEVLRNVGVSMGVWTPTPYAVTLSRWWFG